MGRLDCRERCPLSLAWFLRWQKLAAQPVLHFSTGNQNVPNAHITKADRIWWAVGKKIRSGGGKQEFYDCGTHRLGFTARDLGFSSRDRSLAAACEN
jgi:hypothetical protein